MVATGRNEPDAASRYLARIPKDVPSAAQVALVTSVSALWNHTRVWQRFATKRAIAACPSHQLMIGSGKDGNIYVVDTSVFPSIGAVNPALTAMANALRVGDHLMQRLGARAGGVLEEVAS